MDSGFRDALSSLSRDEITQLLAQRLQLMPTPSGSPDSVLNRPSNSIPTHNQLSINNISNPNASAMGRSSSQATNTSTAILQPQRQQHNLPASTQSTTVAATPIPAYQSVRFSHSLPNQSPAPSSVSTGIGASMQPPAIPSSSQPFLGFQSLEIPMTRQANQARMSAAAAHLPRRVSLPVRRRTRGVASPAPSLPRRPDVNDSLIDVSLGDGTVVAGIRLKVKVYPPQVRILSP